MQAFQHPSAWNLKTLQKQEHRWRILLSREHNDELADALSKAKASGVSIPDFGVSAFPLTSMRPMLEAVRRELIDGCGFVLMQGLDVSRFEVADLAKIYWGLGAYLGTPSAQNAQGDMLGHVTDLSVRLEDDQRVRGYQTNQHLDFHNDTRDIVGLLCLRTARRGGASRVVSSAMLHNVLLEQHPRLLEALYLPVSVDVKGEATEKFYNGAPFEWAGGRLFCRYQRRNMTMSQRHENAIQLTAMQIEAFDKMDALCQHPDYCFDMDLQPGDMQFLCNYHMLHSRTAYEDVPEKHLRRYLLRLWLNSGLIQTYPPSWTHRFGHLDAWRVNPTAPIFDLSQRLNELAHG